MNEENAPVVDDAAERREAQQVACFGIIANTGMARSCFIEAIDLAIAGDIPAAEAKVGEGDAFFQEAHVAHAQMVTQEAQGQHVPVDILLVHTEDQLMSAETFKIVAEKAILAASRH